MIESVHHPSYYFHFNSLPSAASRAYFEISFPDFPDPPALTPRYGGRRSSAEGPKRAMPPCPSLAVAALGMGLGYVPPPRENVA